MPTRIFVLAALAVAGCSTAPQDTQVMIEGAAGGPDFMDPTSDDVKGKACAFSADQWGDDASDLLADRIDQLGGVTIGGQTTQDLSDLTEALNSSDEVVRQHTALAINMAFDQANIFGVYSNFANVIIIDGPFSGQSAASMLALAEYDPSDDNLTDAMDLLNSGFSDCIDDWYLTTADSDADADGIPADVDCDDENALVGQLLFYDDLNSDDDYFNTTSQKSDEWTWNGASTVATEPGQQVQIGEEESWDNVVVYAEWTSQGSKIGCGFDCLEQCGEYVPEDDCWASWEAYALGYLDAETTAAGLVTFTNLDTEYDICLEEFTMFDGVGSQGVALGVESEGGDEYRIPAGSSIDVYYGSWTTENGVWEPYLDEADLWCYQNGTALLTGGGVLHHRRHPPRGHAVLLHGLLRHRR